MSKLTLHLFLQEVNQRYSDAKVSLQSKVIEDIGNVMIAYKGRSKELMAKERMNREQIELEKAVGFSAVLKKISKSVSSKLFLFLKILIINQFYVFVYRTSL